MWDRNWSILVNNRRISNYFTVVLSHAARVSELCVSHALVASAPGVPLQGIFYLDLVAKCGWGNSLFCSRVFRKLLHDRTYGGGKRRLCRETEVWEQVQDSDPSLPQAAVLQGRGLLSSPSLLQWSCLRAPRASALAQRHSPGLMIYLRYSSSALIPIKRMLLPTLEPRCRLVPVVLNLILFAELMAKDN